MLYSLLSFALLLPHLLPWLRRRSQTLRAMSSALWFNSIRLVTCISPIEYEIAPTNGKACIKGWMNIGAGYCKEKNGPLGIL